MTCDRLQEFQIKSGSSRVSSTEEMAQKTTINNVLQDASRLQGMIDTIKTLTTEISHIHSYILCSPTTDAKLNTRLDQKNKEVLAMLTTMQRDLQLMKEQVSTSGGTQDATSRILKNQYESILKNYRLVKSEYNSVQVKHHEKCTERIQRQLSIAGIPNHEREEMLHKLQEKEGHVFTQNIICNQEQIQVDLSGALQREQDIKALEKDIVDLHGMFKDVHIMVTEQGEVIDRIEDNVTTAGTDVERGVGELNKARQYIEKTRKCKIITGVVLLVVVIVIILIILASAKVFE